MSVLTKRHWKLQEFVAHSANVNCLSLGRKSGRVMVTGGDDRKVNLWALGKPNCIMSLSGHTTSIECVRFDPQEAMVCAGSVSGALKVWDLETAKIIRTLTGHKANLRCLDFHPYGDFIVSGSLDTTIKLWDVRRKGCIYTYKGHNKAVNTLKFSPDGKWVASGGDDGLVKLWDLSAGKLLAEFTEHTASVSDLEFHPNEFLLSSGSADKTVKFWDLESFHLVSTTDDGTLPVRCLVFHPTGTCLFSGSVDIMKVYGWEPSCIYDSVISGWGKISDMTIAQNQLISGSISMNSVSVYIVQLSTINPLCQVDNGSESCIPSQNFPITSPHVRKNFVKASTTQNSCDVKMMDEPNNPDDDIENDNLAFDDLAVVDPEVAFVPRSECIDVPAKGSNFKSIESETQQISIKKTFSITEIPVKLTPTSAPISPVKIPYSSNSPPLKLDYISTVSGSPMKNPNQTYILSSPISVCRPTVMSAFPRNYEVRCQEQMHFDCHSMQFLQSQPNLPSKPVEKATALRRQTPYPPEAVSIVRPTMLIPEKDKDTQPQRAIVYPEQLKSKPLVSDFIPQQRNKPAGLNVDEFLPKTLQGSLGLPGAFQPEMSEAEAMNAVCRENQAVLSVLHHRCQKLKIVVALLKSKNPKIAIETAVHMNDQAVLVDILSNLNRQPTLWTLDICQLLLPSIQDLLQSKYESYMSTGCETLRLILKRFGSLIRTNVDAPPSIGVDLCQEERISKCKSCYDQLLAIQSFILKRQTMQGELGQSFRELLKMMCSDFSNV